jgi:hypothetical protein
MVMSMSMGTLDYSQRIELVGAAADNGLANMVAGLILQNLQEHPRKRRDFARLRGRIAIVAEDAGVAMTLVFSGNMLTLHDGILGVPDVAVRANGDDIVQMSLLPLTRIGALPDPRGSATRAMLGRVHVYGALLHVPSVLRLTRLLSVN